MPFGYICENQEDYRALRRIADNLLYAADIDEEQQLAQLDEINALLDKWENRNA